MADSCSMVLFDNRAKTYPVGVEVKCAFIIKAPYEPSSYDWIGLFRIPWSSDKDKYSYQYVSLSSTWEKDSDKPGSAVFQAGSLPEEDGEYYQFVYFDSNGSIKGASSPFTFKHPHSFDLVEEVMAEDSDMLFITTRQAHLETQVSDLMKENNQLQQNYDELEERLYREKSKAMELEQLYEQLHKQKEREEAAFNKKLNELNQQLHAYEVSTQLMVAEKDEVLRRLSESSNQVDTLTGEVCGLRREKELYVHHVSESNTDKQQLQEQMIRLQERLDHHKYTQDDIEALEIQVATAKQELESKEKAMIEQGELVGSLTARAEAAEERHRLNMAEMETMRETLENLSKKYEDVCHMHDDLKNKHSKTLAEQSTLEEEKKDWESILDGKSREVNRLLSDIVSCKQELEHRKMDEQQFIALKESYKLVKDELSSVSRKLKTKLSEEKQLRALDRLAQERIMNLELKLKEGEKEWKKLGKKNAELERKLEKYRAYRRSAGSSDASQKKKEQPADNSKLGASVPPPFQKKAVSPLEPIVYPPISSREKPSPFRYPVPLEQARVYVEELRIDGDSDEDNTTERFHDAVDAPLALDEQPPESCCMCHTKFDSSFDEQQRTEHVNTHLVSIDPVMDLALHYKCPVCQQVFNKDEVSAKDFERHVVGHFDEC